MRRVIEEERPDFVVLGGDTISNDGSSGSMPKTRDWMKDRWHRATLPMVEAGLRWASVIGNHDLGTEMSAVEVAKLDASFNGSLTSSLNEVNYVLTIMDPTGGIAATNLFFINSHAYGCMSITKGSGCPTPSEVKWYRTESERLKREQQATMPGMAFLHIPPPEMLSVLNEGKYYGQLLDSDGVCCSTLNTGLLANMMDMQNVQTVTFGHDHGNDCFGVLTNSITLAYGRKSGYASYNAPFMLQGARVYELRLNQGTNAKRSIQSQQKANAKSTSTRKGVEDYERQLYQTVIPRHNAKYSINTWLRLVDGSTPTQHPGTTTYRFSKCCTNATAGIVVNILVIIALCVLSIACSLLIIAVVYLRCLRHRIPKTTTTKQDKDFPFTTSFQMTELNADPEMKMLTSDSSDSSEELEV